jgi:hypothetical protein
VYTHTAVPVLNLVRLLNLVHVHIVLNLDLVCILNFSIGPRH